METFRKDETRIFHIRKVHHSHDKLSCFIRKRQRKKVFFIEKETGKTKDSFYINPEDNNFKHNVNNITHEPDFYDSIKQELELFCESNKVILNLITSDFCKDEINLTYTFLTSNILNCKPSTLFGVSNSNDRDNTFNNFVCDLVNLKKHI